MYPELFSIGNLTIHSYGLMMSLAILVCTLLLYREAPREKFDPDLVLEAIIVTSIFGLIGSRLLYIILHWEQYRGSFFSSFFTQFEGLSFHGAMFGGAIALLVWSQLRKVGFLRFADLLAPYLALGYAFGRVGCFLNGCCYGLESNVPWALPIHFGDPVLRHPVQLYAALGGIAIFLILKLIRQSRPFVGFILISLFFLYGLLRLITEFYRYGERIAFGLSSAQWFSISLMIISLAVIAFFYFVLPEESKKSDVQVPRQKGFEPRSGKRKR